MKTRECVKGPEASPMYRLGRHWNTIQAYLIPGIVDDIGEPGEDLKRFAQTCELLINDAMFAKYRWCGNDRPPLRNPFYKPNRNLLYYYHLDNVSNLDIHE